MEFRLDSHTHTLASGHAYCTLLEMVRAAADRGLELICITDHAPGMELTTHKDYFLNFRVIDREMYGVRVMMGAELNVMDFDGTVDLSPKLLNNLDMAIASQHIWCMPQGGGPEENTAAMVLAMDNCPKICILGHPDDGRYPLDYPALVRAAGERSVLLEVNNTSLSPACSRVNSTANVTEMLKHCRREGVPVVVGSDAHFVSAVGGHQYAQALLDELDFPEELVLGGDVHRLYVTLGQFSIIRMERDTQLLIPAYDYCLPDKECTCGGCECGQEDPCEIFRKVQFPVNEFFPPNSLTPKTATSYQEARGCCCGS